MTERENTETTVEYYGKRLCFESDPDLTVEGYIEEVVAPLMIAMGYFPTNVYRALNMKETLEVIEDVIKEGRLYE